jgi:dipeptide transport system ATP-binding protein
MQLGRIVEHGSTEGVFGSPRHAYTEALIAATPRLTDSLLRGMS